MAFTSHDPHNGRELARVLYLGARAVRRDSRGKSTRAIENEIQRIRETAQDREDANARNRR
ncbi:hypothetical protein [Streptomyces sp. H27-D2]|uniref:hypothetical protein n=1 Tax=Streptomyces sp. H27-D2 TaxID=3046304 RepID=UPI002DBDD5A2|nr:hypothetical protein [Streptomyces sp. H27-D2]MEC4014937.1 hypothetical protein [Streptomyces sp. H27-D2]